MKNFSKNKSSAEISPSERKEKKRKTQNITISEEEINMASHQEIDEDLHSRQIAVYGKENMKKISSSSILILGAGALAVEIAKNIILAGVKKITIQDTETVKLWDLAGQFYLNENDIGKNRATCCEHLLQELNPAVSVNAISHELTHGLIDEHKVIIMTCGDEDKAIELNSYCRDKSRNKYFIRTRIHGVFASIFCDFGDEFEVVDVDGVDPFTGIVAAITPGNDFLIVLPLNTHKDRYHILIMLM